MAHRLHCGAELRIKIISKWGKWDIIGKMARPNHSTLHLVYIVCGTGGRRIIHCGCRYNQGANKQDGIGVGVGGGVGGGGGGGLRKN